MVHFDFLFYLLHVFPFNDLININDWFIRILFFHLNLKQFNYFNYR